MVGAAGAGITGTTEGTSTDTADAGFTFGTVIVAVVGRAGTTMDVEVAAGAAADGIAGTVVIAALGGRRLRTRFG